MTVKEYLQQAYEINRKIRLDTQKLEAVRASLYGRTVRYDPGMPSAGTRRNSIEIAYARVLEYEEQIDAEIDKLIEKRLEIEQAINAVPNERYREILTRRYLLYQKWEEIAAAIDKDLSWTHKLHNKALGKIQIRH